VVVPFHKTIVDWLTLKDEDGSYPAGEYAVDPLKGRERIAVFCLDETKAEGPLSGYALRHLPAELAAAGKWKELSELLQNPRFIKRRLRVKGCMPCLAIMI